MTTPGAPFLTRYGLPAATLLVVVLLWIAIVDGFDVPPYIFPGLLDVAHAFADRRGFLLGAFLATLATSVGGLAIAALFGFSLAMLFLRFAWVERALMPYVILVQTTPIVAIAPLIVLWAGNGMWSRTLIATLICFFPVVVNAVKGFRNAGRSQLELLHTLNARPRQAFTMLRLPAALPDLFAALRIAGALCVIGSIVGELVTGNSGLGFVILQASYQLDTPLLFAAVLCAAAMGIGLFLAMVFIEQAIPQSRHRD
jgi:NitT/TauT family transport system permease protein